MTVKYFYIMGSSTGVGKSTLCEGSLSQLLHRGYRPEQLAYIKPMTQCINKQSVTIFCEHKKITHQGIGSLVFKKGFTKDFISGVTKNSTEFLKDILSEIRQVGKNKDVVIVDGIGGISTGSVIGISNVDNAISLNAPMLFVGKVSIGFAIDDTILAVSFMQQRGTENIALVYNKIELPEISTVSYYVRKRLAQLLPTIPILDFIAHHSSLDSQSIHISADKIYPWFNSHI